MSSERNLHFDTLEERALLAADLGVGPENVMPHPGPSPPAAVAEPAAVDGVGNNVDNPELGSTGEQLIRITTVEYGDGISTPGGEDRPSAREVSNAISAQDESILNDRYLTDLVYVWGQFVDHDIDLTTSADPAEPLEIAVPAGDPYFDPTGSGDAVIGTNRSVYDETTGDSIDNPRQQINQITAFLDGSVVYGSDQATSDALRTFAGGRMRTSDGDLLPFADETETSFLAGDIRANENVALIGMQTLWVREHNRIADQIAAENPQLTDEQIYQQARSLVTAEIQAITYNEYLPALLGYDAISAYSGYDSTVDPSIANIFSTAAYRFGHSMLSTEVHRLNNDGTVIDAGNLTLAEAFFNPQAIVDHGIDSVLLGAASDLAEEIDTKVVDDIRNFLFGPPGAGGLDLASLNIERGRDHGLADYNQARIDLGLTPVTSFSDITSDPELAAALEATYGDVNNIDVWVGGLAEDHLPGSSMGELFSTIIADQFERIRDGDRFWYQNVFSGEQLREIENTTLADVMERNTEITGLQENVFFDKSVMLFEAPAGRHPSDVTVVVTDERVTLLDNVHQQVIETRELADVSQVMLVGSDRQADSFTVDVRTDNVSLPGGLVIYGGDGGGDRLTIRGTRGSDQIVIDGRDVSVNGGEILRSGFETLRIDPGRGPDNIEVIDPGNSDLQLLGRRLTALHGDRGPEGPRDRMETNHRPTQETPRESRNDPAPRGDQPQGPVAPREEPSAERRADRDEVADPMRGPRSELNDALQEMARDFAGRPPRETDRRGGR